MADVAPPKLSRRLPVELRTALASRMPRRTPIGELLAALPAGWALVSRDPRAVLLRHADGAFAEIELRAEQVNAWRPIAGEQAHRLALHLAHRVGKLVDGLALVGLPLPTARAALRSALGAASAGLLDVPDGGVHLMTVPGHVGIALGFQHDRVVSARAVVDEATAVMLDAVTGSD